MINPEELGKQMEEACKRLSEQIGEEKFQELWKEIGLKIAEWVRDYDART